MRKAESRVRGLIYQKKIILLQLGGYEECETEALRRLTSMGAVSPAAPTTVPPRRRFRAAVRVVITTNRLRWLVSRSKKLIHDGVQTLLRNDKENTSGGRHSDQRSKPTKPSSSGSKPHLRSHHTNKVEQSRNSSQPNSARSHSSKDSRKSYHSTSSRPSRPHSSHEKPASAHTYSTVYGQLGNARPHSPALSDHTNGHSEHTLTPTSRPNSQLSSHKGSESRPTSRPHSQMSSRRSSKHGSSREDLRACTPPGSPIDRLSGRSTPRNSPRDGRASPSSTSSCNRGRHAHCVPSDPLYTRPAPAPSADDSVAENINRLERIHERLNDLQKTSNYKPSDAFM